MYKFIKSINYYKFIYYKFIKSKSTFCESGGEQQRQGDILSFILNLCFHI